MSVDAPMIEIREWGRPARRRSLNRSLLVGRDCAGELLADDGVSRQHLRLVPTPTALSVIDLDSRNGTTVNGVALTRRTDLAPGDVVRLGRSEIIVLRTPTRAPPPCEMTPPRWTTLAERVLGIDPTDTDIIDQAARVWKDNAFRDELLEGARLADAETLAAKPGFRNRLNAAREYLLDSRQCENRRAEAALRAKRDDVAQRSAAAGQLAKCETQQRQGIFVCYRRKDSRWQAGRLADALVSRFGERAVFMDVHHLRIGNWRKQIDKSLADCTAVIVVIGPQWIAELDHRSASGDQVRYEIARALRLGKIIIPVAVDRAQLPHRGDLPDDIAALNDAQGYELGVDVMWRPTVGKLLDDLSERLQHSGTRCGDGMVDPLLSLGFEGHMNWAEAMT